MRQWQLIVERAGRAGAFNMAVDDVLLERVSAGQRRPTLRLYAWEPMCLSLGYGQSATDVDIERLNARGWGMVRRPTGGKAILHGDELTYSLTLPMNDPLAEGDVVASYRRISVALTAMLVALDLSPHSEQAARGQNGLGPVCFEVPSHYEITVGGRKLIGSAQVRRRGGLLQHGTIPLTGDIARICDVLRYDSEDERAAAAQHVRRRALTLAQAAGFPVSFEEAAAALIEGFAQTFDVEWVDGTLTTAEQALVEQHTASTYGDTAWTHKR